MKLQNKKVLVFGTGISGIAAVKLLEDAGAVPVLFDGNTQLKEEDIRAKLPEGSHTEILLGDLTDEQIQSLDLAVLSPGVPTDIPLVNRMRDAGLRSGERLNLPMNVAKEMYLPSRAPTVKQRQPAFWVLLCSMQKNLHLLWEILEYLIRRS